MKQKSKAIYIDASPLLSHKLSGVGHLALMMIHGLMEQNEQTHEYTIKLLVPARKVAYMRHWGFDEKMIVKIPLLARIWNTLPRLPFGLPIDIFFGRGVYIFPNFKKWSLMRSRSITYVHDISFLIYPQFTEPKNLKLLQGNIAKWMDRSNVIVTDSNTSKDEIAERFPLLTQKIKKIYCGVDTTLFHKQDDAAIKKIRRKYHLDKSYFMYLGNLEPRKNILTILEGLQSLPQGFKETHSLLLVGGMGWNNEAITEKMKELRSEGWNIIKPESYVPDDDLPALLSGAEMLLYPALYEGFGIPPIEAMACGTPVIVSDIAVFHEVCGEAAVYVDPHQATDLGDAIQRLLKDEKYRTKNIALGYTQAARYTWKQATTELTKMIDEQLEAMR